MKPAHILALGLSALGPQPVLGQDAGTPAHKPGETYEAVSIDSFQNRVRAVLLRLLDLSGMPQDSAPRAPSPQTPEAPGAPSRAPGEAPRAKESRTRRPIDRTPEEIRQMIGGETPEAPGEAPRAKESRTRRPIDMTPEEIRQMIDRGAPSPPASGAPPATKPRPIDMTPEELRERIDGDEG